MWQEIVVGLVVTASAVYAGSRVLRIFRTAKDAGVSCQCDCSQCGQKDAHRTSCQELPTKGPGSFSS
jgi:hypothetical protein